ncbi:MAG: GDP-mannose 4,6-dehydratase [Alphaproteobacteria bacterium]|nr:GDP-mannose 4,6-dehydratase [Alphaproteobacteria bacterium]
MAILITGAAGFIGSTFADRLLSSGKKIIALDNFNDYYDVKIKEANIAPNLANPNYKLYRADITNAAALKKVFDENEIEAVVHLAARAGVRPSIENPRAYMDTNIIGTLNIFEEMKSRGLTKLIYASSSSVYGNCKAEKFSEDLDVSTPISPYAMTKKANEEMAHVYHKLYNISSIGLRFFTVYGPRQRPDLAINKFVQLIETDRPIPVFGDGSAVRDFTFIDDIVDGVAGSLDYVMRADKPVYEILNLGGGNPVDLNRMISTIESALGKKATIDRLPMQPGDVDRTASDCSKAKRLVGYEPKTSFKDGIDKFVAWLRQA